MRGILLLLALGLSLTHGIQDQAKIGSLKFTPPKGWKPTTESGPTVAAYAAPDLPAGKVCQVKVFPDEVSTEAFDMWLTRKWSKEVSSKRLLLRTSDFAKQKIGAIEVALGSGAYKEGSGEAYVLLVGLVAEGHRIYLLYESNDYEIWEKRQNEVFDIFDSMDIAEAGSTKPPTPPVTSPGSGTSPTLQLSSEGPVVRSRPSLAIPGQLPDGTPMPAGTPDQAATILAKKVTAYTADSLPALVTAVRASGFTIKTPDQKLVAKPLPAKGNGIYVEDDELLTFFAMTCRGDSLEATGLFSAIDYVFEQSSVPLRASELVSTSIAKGLASTEPSTRFFARFLVEMGKSLPQKYDLSKNQSGRATRITPIEAFLILRTLAEDIARQTAKAIEGGVPEPMPLLGNAFDLFAMAGYESQDGMPSYEVKGVTFSINYVISEIVKALKNETRITLLKSAKLLTSLIKFLSTYYCLEATFKVVDPGEPLIRTKSMSANGERRTLEAEIKMNATKLHAFLKKWRMALAFTGVDFDMPNPGKLAKVSTRWRLLGYTGMNTLDKPVQFVGSNIEQVEADGEGVARVDIEGTKQRRLIPATSPPVKMQIPIAVMVQVKGAEIRQDMVDAFGSAVGLGGSNPMWAVPGVMQEMIYRSKLLVNGTMNLKFVDWQPGSFKAAYSIHVSGNGVYRPPNSKTDKTVWSVNRTYMAEGWLVPDVNAYMPPVALELQNVPGNRTVFNFVRSSDHWQVNDSEVRDFIAAACADDKKITGHSEETYKGPLGDDKGHPANNRGMYYVYDYGTQKMYLEIREPTVDGTHRQYATLNGKVTKNKVEDIGFGLFPDRMSKAVASGKPLGQKVVPYRDPSELAAGEVISGDFSYKQVYNYHNGFLTVKYQFLIKPTFDEEGEPLYSIAALRPNPVHSLVKRLQTPEIEETEDEALTCFPTNVGPLRSLRK